MQNAPNMIRQTMFTVGEVDISVYKRTDIESYLTGAQSLQNMEVGTTGLCKKRKGTQYLINVTSYFDPNSQIYEFEDKNGNYYAIMSNATSVVPGPGGLATWVVFSINASTGALTFLSQIVNISGGTALPYTSAQLPQLDYALDNDSLVLTHPLYPQARIYVSNYTGPVFSYQVLNIYPLPAYDFGVVNYNQSGTTATAAVNGNAGDTLTFVVNDAVFTTDWIGGQILSAGQNVNQPIGYAIITNVQPNVPSAGNTTFTAIIQIPMNGVNPGPYVSIGSQYAIRQPAFGATVGYPGVVSFYQNRLWFANTLLLPGTVFGSKINQPINFDVGTGAYTDAIIYNIGQTNSGGILWMNGGKQLEIYSENFEFAAPQEQNLGLTPSSFSIRLQSAYGSFVDTKPTTYINDSYYIAKNGNSIINFHFNGIGQTYVSSNVSLVSQHLVKQPINRALLRGDSISQDNFIYYLNSDNSVTAFQFVAEFKLAALTPVVFAQGVTVNEICTINNHVYFLKNYKNVTGGPLQTLEVFNNTVKMDGWITATMASDGTINGLSQFNGYTVQVTYTAMDGSINDLGQELVTGGTIIADNPNAFSGDVQVGLLYDVILQPMYVTPGSTRYISASGRTYDFKNLNRIYVDYINSLNFYINGTLVNYQYYSDIQAGTGLMPKTDTGIVSVQGGYNRFSTFQITQSAPFDLQITAIAYQIESDII